MADHATTGVVRERGMTVITEPDTRAGPNASRSAAGGDNSPADVFGGPSGLRDTPASTPGTTPRQDSGAAAGTSCGATVAALNSPGTQLPNPRTWIDDVFISHTGAQKDLANSLNVALKQLKLRPFFDLDSLQGTMGNDVIMDEAAQRAPVGVLLLSPEFFERRWPLRELAIIMDTGNYLPVWTGKDFNDLKQFLKSKPDKSQLFELEWGQLVHKLEYATTIIHGNRFTAHLLDEVLFAVIRRSYQLCSAFGNQEQYNSAQMQQYRNRVISALTKIGDPEEHVLSSIPVQNAKEAAKWLAELCVLNQQLLSQSHVKRVPFNPSPPTPGSSFGKILEEPTVQAPQQASESASGEPPTAMSDWKRFRVPDRLRMAALDALSRGYMDNPRESPGLLSLVFELKESDVEVVEFAENGKVSEANKIDESDTSCSAWAHSEFGNLCGVGASQETLKSLVTTHTMLRMLHVRIKGGAEIAKTRVRNQFLEECKQIPARLSPEGICNIYGTYYCGSEDWVWIGGEFIEKKLQKADLEWKVVRWKSEPNADEEKDPVDKEKSWRESTLTGKDVGVIRRRKSKGRPIWDLIPEGRTDLKEARIALQQHVDGLDDRSWQLLIPKLPGVQEEPTGRLPTDESSPKCAIVKTQGLMLRGVDSRRQTEIIESVEFLYHDHDVPSDVDQKEQLLLGEFESIVCVEAWYHIETKRGVDQAYMTGLRFIVRDAEGGVRSKPFGTQFATERKGSLGRYEHMKGRVPALGPDPDGRRVIVGCRYYSRPKLPLFWAYLWKLFEPNMNAIRMAELLLRTKSDMAPVSYA